MCVGTPFGAPLRRGNKLINKLNLKENTQIGRGTTIRTLQQYRD